MWLVILVKYHPIWVVLNFMIIAHIAAFFVKNSTHLLGMPCKYKKYYKAQYRWLLAPSQTMTKWYCTMYDTPSIHQWWNLLLHIISWPSFTIFKWIPLFFWSLDYTSNNRYYRLHLSTQIKCNLRLPVGPIGCTIKFQQSISTQIDCKRPILIELWLSEFWLQNLPFAITASIFTKP